MQLVVQQEEVPGIEPGDLGCQSSIGPCSFICDRDQRKLTIELGSNEQVTCFWVVRIPENPV